MGQEFRPRMESFFGDKHEANDGITAIPFPIGNSSINEP